MAININGTGSITGLSSISSPTISGGSVPLGDATAPGIVFSGDPNTGIYSPGADQVAISTGGSGRLFVDSSGKVGVGTSTPSSTSGGVDISSGGIGLVVGADGSASTRTNAADKIFRIGSAHYTNAEEPVCIAFGQNLSSDNELNFGGGSAALNAATYMRFFTAANNTTTGGTERMRLDSSGRLGIGTTSVNFGAIDHGVHIYGSGAQEGIRLETTNGSGGILEIYAENGGNTLDTRGSGYIRFNNAASEWGRWDSSGRLLVGTSTARTNFSNSTDDPQLQIESANGFGWASVRNSNTSGGAYVYIAKSRGTGNVILQNNDIIGGLNFEGNDGSEFVTAAQIRTEVDGTPGANDMPGRLVFSTTADGASSPTERMRITNSGEILIQKTSFNATTGVGIGYQPSSQQFSQVIDTNVNTYTLYNTSASAYRFYVNQAGTIFATSTTISAISDQRLKKNICDLDVGLDAILALKPRKFDWKEKSGNIGTNIRGFIAQEVEEVFPDLIDEWEKGENHPEGEDPYKSVRQDLIPVLVKAIQEQQAMIAELQAKVAALESA